MNSFNTTPTRSGLAAAVTAGILLAHASQSQAATVRYDFNLPATSVASQTPPYVTVATLTLTDSSNGVIFTLDPNEGNEGYSVHSSISALNIVYSGSSDLASSAYDNQTPDTEADANSFPGNLLAVVPPPANAPNMDSSYKSEDGQLKLTWDNDVFMFDEISTWIITGTTIAANFTLAALSNSNPSPNFGILSTSDLALHGSQNASSSNWITGPAAVSIPAALWLFSSAILGLVGLGRRKNRA